MSAENTLNEEKSIDEDAELLALEDLLCVPDELEKNEVTTQSRPTLREDNFLAEEFSYEMKLPSENSQSSLKNVNVNIEEPDSSDDEEVKNFLERKYNEYGTDINKKLKQQRQEKHESKIAQEVQKTLSQTEQTSSNSLCNNGTENQIKNPHQPKVRQSFLSTNFQSTVSPQALNATKTKVTPTISAPVVPTYTDPVFGLRIINPLISSTLLIERMNGRKSVPVSQIPFHIERGDLTKDWVFAGAVVNKSPIQTTKKGAPYSIWRLSDLRGEIKLVSLFLFSGAHKELWKTAQGMCIAVLNPTVFEKRAKSDEVACLSIDTAQKVLVLGQSKDMGTCKARKKNGDQCTSIVNLGECDYCIFHMKQEYNKMSKRSELQSTSGGLNELRNKVLGKSEVFYGGQSYTAIPAKKSTKLTLKDNQRMSALSEYAVSPLAGSVNHSSKPRSLFNKPVPYAAPDGPVSKLASTVEVNTKQRQKDLERLRILQGETANHVQMSKDNSETNSPTTTTTQSTSNVSDKFKNREFSFLSQTPKLSSENFSFEINIGEKRSNFAKQKAAQILKQRPLEKINPNSTRGTMAGKRRAIDELNEKFTSQEFKRQKLEEEQRENERKTRIQRIIDASSSNSNLIDFREQQEQDKYFSKLEKKEALEEKMLNTYKVPCKAVICQRCKYTAFSAAERCKEEKHPLKLIDAEKRFFKCKDCGNRTCTVFKLPKTSCKNCQSSRWERAAMIAEKKLCTTGDGLSVRGDEETFIGSLAGKANLNLLVPEE